jgi:hypothetical protein
MGEMQNRWMKKLSRSEFLDDVYLKILAASHVTLTLLEIKMVFCCMKHVD